MRSLLLFVIPVLSVGCATLHPRAQANGVYFKPFGEVSETEQMRSGFKTRLASNLGALAEPEQLAAQAPELKILERTLPDGVTFKDGVISTSPESGLTVPDRRANGELRLV